jgi:MFS family permease
MLAIALLALIPYILVASGAVLYEEEVMRDINASRATMTIIQGLSVAGYAFGALFAGDLINRFVQRSLFLVCQAIFIVGWLVVVISHGPIVYGAGRVLSGFATGMLLVIALPPIVRRFPKSHLPLTAAFINIAFFGAVAAGPLLGGIVAAEHAWRMLYASFSIIGALTLIAAIFSLPKIEPNNPHLPIDYSGLALGFAGTVLPFVAAGELTSHGFGSPVVAIPLGIGLVCFGMLMFVEYHKQEPLAPVSIMWTTFPVIGALVAMIGGGAFVTYVDLTVRFLMDIAHSTPLAAGLSFWPQVVGVVLSATLLRLIFGSRFLPLLAYGGMLLLVVGGALLRFDVYSSHGSLYAAVGLLGLGAGATVSPGLFLAGLSLQTQFIGRILALVELVRSVADFILAPVMMRVAIESSGGSHAALDIAGLHEGVAVTVLMTFAGLIIVSALHIASAGGLPHPDLEAWLKQNKPAISSPRLLQALRGR